MNWKVLFAKDNPLMRLFRLGTGEGESTRPIMSGVLAFYLCDTKGLPLELLEDFCEQNDMIFDRKTFDFLSAQRRQDSQKRTMFTPLWKAGD